MGNKLNLNWSNVVVFGSAVMVCIGIINNIVPMTVIGFVVAGISFFMEK